MRIFDRRRGSLLVHPKLLTWKTLLDESSFAPQLQRIMTESDSLSILGWIDSALELFRANKKLSAREIRVLSMLAVVRQELADELEQGKKSALS